MKTSSTESSRFDAFGKRILVAVSGLSPAILTETLYALAVENKDSFIPTEIHLITTIEGKQRAINSLLKGKEAAFHALCNDYDLPSIEFDETHIHVIQDAQGNPMDDIRMPQDNEAAADFITDKIFKLSRDDDAALHVSIAGGRKTMGYYVGYALSLFGRQQDRLSHVLVDPDYECCPDFFYPTKSEIVKINFNKKPVDLSEAKVYLAEIPFVRINQHVGKNVVKKDNLLSGKTSFSNAVQLFQASTNAEQLEIDFNTQEITVNRFKLKWGKKEETCIAFYAWIIERQFKDNSAVSRPLEDYPEGQHAKSFLEFFDRVTDRGINKKILESFEDNKGMSFAFFRDRLNEINNFLKQNLGIALASLFTVNKVEHMKYKVELDEEIINIIELD